MKIKQKKQPKKAKTPITRIVILMFPTLFFILAIYAFIGIASVAYSYGISIHNIDLSYNILLISNDLNRLNSWNISYRDITDEYSPGKSQPYTQFYIEGMNNLEKGFFDAIKYVLVFVIGLCGLLVWREK